MKTKLSITEVYRLDTELEVEQFISDERVKADKEGYELKGYKSAKKENLACGFGVGLAWGSMRFITDHLKAVELLDYEY